MSFSLVDVMADCTEVIVYFDLMLAASAFSLFRKAVICCIVSLGGMTRVTIDVPLLERRKGMIRKLNLRVIEFGVAW